MPLLLGAGPPPWQQQPGTSHAGCHHAQGPEVVTVPLGTVCVASSGIRHCQSCTQLGLTSLEETHSHRHWRSLGLP